MAPLDETPVPTDPGPVGVWVGLALGALLLSLLAAAFWGGFVLGRDKVEADYILSIKALQAVQAERDALLREVADLKQQSAACEQMQRIDQEKDRSAQEQLKEAQDQRLALAKEVATLKRLVRSGGHGGVAVQGLRVTAGEEPREFRYSFTVSQLVEDVGEIAGRIAIQIAGKQGDKDKSFTLDQLEGAKPARLEMRFEHFQNFEGSLVLPAGFEPLSLTVVVEPEGEHVIESEKTFPWQVSE